MGLFDALTKSVGKKLSSEGVTKLEKGMVKLIGSIEGREKEEVKKAPNPKISAVTWADKSGQKANKAKYEKELFIHIDTQNAYGSLLSALIVIHCDNWTEDYVALRPIMRSELFHGSGNYIEKTKFSFIPKIEWLKEPSVEESSISANIYLFCFCYMGYSSTEDNSYGLKQLVEAIKRKDNDYRNYTAGNVRKPNIITQKEAECLKLEYGGYFYLKDGTFMKRIGKSSDTYISDNESLKNTEILTDASGKNIEHELFIEIAGWAYNENTIDLKSQKATLGMLKNWIFAKEFYYGFDNIKDYRTAIDYAYRSSGAAKSSKFFEKQRNFINTENVSRNESKGMKNAICAFIHVLTGGLDYSYSAVQEHGRDFFIQYQDKSKTKEWRMYREQQDNGYTWMDGGNFEGDYTPQSKPSHKGIISKSYKYIITASYDGNIYAKFSSTKSKKR